MSNLYKMEHDQILQERLIEVVEKHLELKQWKFKLSYKSREKGYVAIYDSPFCRLRFSLSLDPRDKDDTISTSYGRSHAPNDDYYVMHRGENCLAWHNYITDYIGQFLDGTDPRRLARAKMERTNIYSHAKKVFEESGMAKGLRSPVYGLRLTTFAWEYYGSSLFELFDKNHLHKWEAYRNFLTELYDELAKNPNWEKRFAEWPNWKPFPWQVC